MCPPPGDLEARLRILWGEEPTWFHPYPSLEEFNLRRSNFLASLNPEIRERIATWLSIGRSNPWIRSAYDPPFTELSFEICADVRHLADRILQGNWCLGQAFALDDMCFINQIDGGDEWLTIKGKTDFESITMRRYEKSREAAERKLFELVERIRRATEEECRRLDY